MIRLKIVHRTIAVTSAAPLSFEAPDNFGFIVLVSSVPLANLTDFYFHNPAFVTLW